MCFTTLVSACVGRAKPEVTVPDEMMLFTLNKSQTTAIQLLTPAFQRDLDENKVDALQVLCNTTPKHWYRINTITIAVLGTSMYLVDGQHRVAMLHGCLTDMPTRAVFYNIHSDAEMRDLYCNINKESSMHEAYVSLGASEQALSDALVKYLERHILYFRKRKSSEHQRTIKQTVQELLPFIQACTASGVSDRDAIQVLEDKNAQFQDIVSFTFPPFTEEKTSVNAKFWMSLTRANFVDFVNTDAVPAYEGCRPRKMVTRGLRVAVFRREFGDAVEGLCPRCNLTPLFLNESKGFHCGHVKSHKNGGDESLENLRPICATCNDRMGSSNWD